MKSALQFLKDMYDEGTLAKDFITMDEQSVFEEAGSGRCGIWFGPNWGGMNPAIDATQNDINCHIVAAAVPSATGEATKAYASSSVSTVYCVSSQCSNLEVLVKLWNLSVKYQNADNCTKEEYNMYFGDSENYSGWKTSIIYGEAPNGRATNLALVAALESGDASSLNAKQTENYESMKAYIDAVEAGTFDPTDTTQQRGLSLYTVHADPQCAWKVLHTMIANDDYVLAAYNGVPSETVSEESTTLQKLLVETIVKIITGAQDVDSYDSFLDTWYAYGGQDAMDEANASR
jgi:putative aldouronate transport system substrate-binding protein